VSPFSTLFLLVAACGAHRVFYLSFAGVVFWFGLLIRIEVQSAEGQLGEYFLFMCEIAVLGGHRRVLLVSQVFIWSIGNMVRVHMPSLMTLFGCRLVAHGMKAPVLNRGQPCRRHRGGGVFRAPAAAQTLSSPFISRTISDEASSDTLSDGPRESVVPTDPAASQTRVAFSSFTLSKGSQR
jgi:hypothetical protein